MTQNCPDCDQLVDLIIEMQKRLGDGDELVAAIASSGITTEDAEYLVSIVRDAHCRSVLVTTVMKADQFHGDYETNPIFQAALKRFLSASNGSLPQGVSTERPERYVFTSDRLRVATGYLLLIFLLIVLIVRITALLRTL